MSGWTGLVTMGLTPLEGYQPPGVSSFDLPPIIPGVPWFNRYLLEAIVAVVLIMAFWVVMSRKTALVPSKAQFVGQVNSIKLAIADASDSILDSAVFIQSGTFTAIPLGLSINDASIEEGDSGTSVAKFTVSLAPTSGQTVLVDYATQNVTASAPEDYVAASGTLTFVPGDTFKTISVVIKGDTKVEANEIFFVNLANNLMRPNSPPLGDGRGIGTIVNDDGGAPKVSNFSKTVTEDRTLSFSTSDFDASYQSIKNTLQSVRVDTLPTSFGGKLTLDGQDVTAGQIIARADLNRLRFVPVVNVNGNVTFQYSASDGTDFSNAGATVTISITPVNDAPTISRVANQTIEQDSSTAALSFSVGDIDNALTDLTVTATSSNDLFADDNIVLGGSGANRTVKLTPAAGRQGRSTITLKVSDGTATTSSKFVVTVTEINVPPTLKDAFYNGTRNVAFSTQLQGQDANDRDSSLTYSVLNGRLPAGLSLSSSGVISGTPTQAGNTTADIRVSDGRATGIGRIRFAIALTRTGGAFVVDNQTLSASLNRSFTYTLMARGEPGDSFTFAVAAGSSLPPGLSLSSGGTLSGKPSKNGSFSFSVRVSNGSDTVIARYVLVVTDRTDGVGPVIVRDALPTPITRDALKARTLTGTVRDAAPSGVTPTGVRQMFVQLRRVRDGQAYSGRAFTRDTTLGYYPVTISAATSNPAATRDWSRDLSFLPSIGPGDYLFNVLAEDNVGNFSTTVIAFTIVAPASEPPASEPPASEPPASDGESGGKS